MRIGHAPTRQARNTIRPARVTAGIVVCIPNQDGYYSHRFDVLKLSLASLVLHTEPGTADFAVFDNGSCAEVSGFLDELLASGTIRYLTKSTSNIGKMNAVQMLVRSAPADIVAIADDDVFYYPGWLGTQLEILDTFPRVGTVSGVPVRFQFRYGNKYLPEFLAAFPKVRITRERSIPDEWETDFAISIGQNVGTHFEKTAALDDILLEYNGVTAYSTAVHFQYVARKSVLLEMFPVDWDDRMMGSDLAIDERIDALGYARLSTRERYVRHIGNVVTPELAALAKNFGLHANAFAPPRAAVGKLIRSLVPFPFFRRVRNWAWFARRYRKL